MATFNPNHLMAAGAAAAAFKQKKPVVNYPGMKPTTPGIVGAGGAVTGMSASQAKAGAPLVQKNGATQLPGGGWMPGGTPKPGLGGLGGVVMGMSADQAKQHITQPNGSIKLANGGYTPPTNFGMVGAGGVVPIAQQGTPEKTYEPMSYNDAMTQANMQLNPLYDTATAAAQAEGYQNNLNAGELSSAHGGAHSGLGADLQNKVNINTTNAIKQLAAERAAKAAGMATDLVNRSEQNMQWNKTFDHNVEQDAENNAINKANQTGIYESPQMKALYDETLQAKQDYANAKTPAERAAAHQRAETARVKLEGMNANTSLVGSNVTLNQANSNSNQFGTQTLESKRQAYEQSKDNPANQAQIISNKIDSLKLQHLPETMKLELEQLKQQVSTGKIDVQTAEYNLNELTNPNSVTNQRNKLQLQLDQMNVSNTSTQNKLEVQKLQKQIAQIGKVKPQSSYDSQMNQIKLDTAKIKLEKLKKDGGSTSTAVSYKSNPNFAADISYIQSTPNALSEIQSNSEELINEYGYDGYQALLSAAGG